MNHHHLQLPIYLNCFHYKTVLELSIGETVTTQLWVYCILLSH
jgi:hypothetical protein